SFYVFVPTHAFVAERVRTYVVPRTEVNTIINKTTIINNSITIQNNVVVNRGPSVKEVEKLSRRKIERVSIERVKNVAPKGSFSRDEIRVDPQMMKKGLKVAEPVSGKALPPAARGRAKRDGGGEARGGTEGEQNKVEQGAGR